MTQVLNTGFSIFPAELNGNYVVLVKHTNGTLLAMTPSNFNAAYQALFDVMSHWDGNAGFQLLTKVSDTMDTIAEPYFGMECNTQAFTDYCAANAILHGNTQDPTFTAWKDIQILNSAHTYPENSYQKPEWEVMES